MHATLVPNLGAETKGTPVLVRALVDASGAVVHVLRLWSDAPAEPSWTVVDHFRGLAADAEPAFVQALWFDGPRDARWTDAQDRAGRERMWPATSDLEGLVDVLLLRALDGGTLVLTAALTEAVLAEGSSRIMSTALLPGEDPADLTGPDRFASYAVRAVAGAR